MKKVLYILLFVLIAGSIFGVIYYVFSEVTPLDDTKKLYINCNNHHNSYNVLSGTIIDFAQNDNNCKLSLEVRDVERNFIKLKSTTYVFNTINDNINEIGTYDIYIDSNAKQVLFKTDKKTKIEIMYK